MTQSISRRKALTGAAAIGVAVPTLAACGDDASETAEDAASAATSAAGGAIAAAADIPEGGGAIFADAGVVVTQPAAGDFKGFSSACTHRGCAVSDVTTTINCKCHGSQFSLEDGSVITGPATDPLEAMELTVDGDSISLA